MTKLTFLSFGKHLVPLLINSKPGMKAWAKQICHLCSPGAPHHRQAFSPRKGGRLPHSLPVAGEPTVEGGGVFPWHPPRHSGLWYSMEPSLAFSAPYLNKIEDSSLNKYLLNVHYVHYLCARHCVKDWIWYWVKQSYKTETKMTTILQDFGKNQINKLMARECAL